MSEHSITPRYEPARLVLIAAALTSCLLLLGGGNVWPATAATTEPDRQTETKPEVLSLQPTEPSETAEIQLIKVTRFGFEPRELERSNNLFVLAVHNLSHKADLVLRLHRVQGERLHEVRMSRSKRKWQLPLTLPPGDYLLTEASQPDWQCQIRLTN
jgi:hypothetical protein